jgi:hypothetical protein
MPCSLIFTARTGSDFARFAEIPSFFDTASSISNTTRLVPSSSCMRAIQGPIRWKIPRLWTWMLSTSANLSTTSPPSPSASEWTTRKASVTAGRPRNSVRWRTARSTKSPRRVSGTNCSPVWKRRSGTRERGFQSPLPAGAPVLSYTFTQSPGFAPAEASRIIAGNTDGCAVWYLSHTQGVCQREVSKAGPGAADGGGPSERRGRNGGPEGPEGRYGRWGGRSNADMSA